MLLLLRLFFRKIAVHIRNIKSLERHDINSFIYRECEKNCEVAPVVSGRFWVRVVVSRIQRAYASRRASAVHSSQLVHWPRAYLT